MTNIGWATLAAVAWSVVAGAPLVDDPSAGPPPHSPGQEGVSWRAAGDGERYRILGDFDGDGIEDMAVSGDAGLFGNGGGSFTLYLRNADGKYRERGTFWSHPTADAIAIERWNHTVRLWTYSHAGGGIGGIGYYDLTENGLSEFHALTIHPGDSGTRMGNAIYRAVFENSDARLRVQRSHAKDGKIEWR